MVGSPAMSKHKGRCTRGARRLHVKPGSIGPADVRSRRLGLRLRRVAARRNEQHSQRFSKQAQEKNEKRRDQDAALASTQKWLGYFRANAPLSSDAVEGSKTPGNRNQQDQS